ncbi:uncharacterized protein THITE_2108480 [Thermothielavioides terrestris NRRL 8126]|uniref:Ser/arg-related nuclear matrix protein n=1 Tax=Thermothielavioides terrestris (strain ATCC 38088 / NRRL 8126) TaxID=578455 RepID=G2QRL0_THETT|nr:uncharacterized protein THITE_2108480 [Thermothielavioides terrestris NRRL 8126]AEO63357.1 hypothetical protein THITE_2108480 [Thermothielavioides terrestris NRRL 8126]
MVEKDDINSLLQTGSWRTSRSRSPSHYDSQGRVYEAAKPNIRVPRTLEPVSMESLSRTKRPPPPCVEDEEESLAKEYVGSIVSAVSDEEPKSRGEIDQQPILLPVHEHNPERRFVIVPGAAPEDASKTAQARYEANTCRKYVLVTSDNGAEDTESAKEEGAKETSSKQKVDQPKEKPDIPKRKSHQELPRLTTDFEHADAPPIRRSGSRRDRERPLVHQEPQDYNKSRDRSSARPPDSAFLSPAAVKHTSGRRERAYSDARSDASGRSSRSPTTRKAAEVEVFDTRRPPHSSNKYPASPGVHRRASSTTTVPRRDSPPRERIRNGPPPERPKSFLQPYGNGDPDEILAYMAPGRDFTPGRPNRDVSPPRRTPINNSPPHPRGAREMPGPSPNRRRQPRSETRDWDGYSSDEAHRERRPTLAERSYPIRSTLDPDRPTLLSPEQTRRPNPKLEPAGPTILAPLGAQVPHDPLQLSSRSATFPSSKTKTASECSASPPPATSSSPPRGPARSTKGPQMGAHSRDASIGPVSNGSGSQPPLGPGSLGRTGTLERSPGGPVATLMQQDPSDPQSPVLYWQPRRSAEQDEAGSGVTSRALARLPGCRWRNAALARNRPGSEQFLTLKRADNFRICPDCYGALFANTQFQHLFVPAPARWGDRAISCDFGSSPWYRIAYIMTLQHKYQDLRLLQGIASVAAQSQACAGSQLATRIWYSMMAPNSRRPVQTFSVCLGCAKMVEVLLPNLAGVFVPLNSHEPTRGICELHYAPDRKRFFDYFEEMKMTSAAALSRRTAPNLIELVDRIREISLHDECLRNTPIPNRKWHVLQRVPEFTVCEECFNSVVWPMIEDEDNGSDMARNFLKHKQLKPVASCQLYSERMRRVFLEACKYDDYDFLANCVLNRLRVLSEVKARYNELQREDQEDPEVQEELAALARQFKEVE